MPKLIVEIEVKISMKKNQLQNHLETRPVYHPLPHISKVIYGLLIDVLFIPFLKYVIEPMNPMNFKVD